MATPAAVLSILITADDTGATTKLKKFQAQLTATNAEAKKGIDARLSGTLNSKGFKAYDDALKRAATRAANQAAFRAELGANFSPRAFKAYSDALDAAEAKAVEAKTVIGDRLNGALKSAAGTALTWGRNFSIAGAAVAGASIYAASKFQSATTLLETQANASAGQVDKLRASMLRMATSVGQTPDKLAEGMYHVVSSMNAVLPAVGRAAAEEHILKIAAEGATLGHAQLADTSYALASAMNALHAPASAAEKVMGTLNATVGAGDMTMKDLLEALKSGLIPVAQNFGISFKSVGASLAVLGDLGVRGALAGTRLRMSIALLGTQTKQASDILQTFGLSQQRAAAKSKQMADTLAAAGVHVSKLASDMRQPDGILVALKDLQDHLELKGVSKEGAAATISRIFGSGRSSSAIQTLEQNLGRLGVKFDQIKEKANNFGKDWAKAQKTTAVQFKNLEGAVIALGIKLGNELLPTFNKVVHALSMFISQMVKGKGAGGEFVKVLGGIWTVLKKVGGALVSVVKWIISMINQFKEGNPYVIAAATALSAVVGSLTALGVVLALMAGWAAAVEVLGTAFIGLASAVGVATAGVGALDVAMGILVAPLFIIPVAIGAVIAAFVLLYLKIKVVHNFINGAWRAIRPVILGVFRGVVAYVKSVWDGIVNIIKGAVRIIRGIIQVIKGVFEGNFKEIWKGVKNIFAGAIQAILGFMESQVIAFWNAGKAFVEGIGHGIEEGAQFAINKMVDFLNGLINDTGINSLLSVFNSLFGTNLKISIGHTHFADQAAKAGKSTQAARNSDAAHFGPGATPGKDRSAGLAERAHRGVPAIQRHRHTHLHTHRHLNTGARVRVPTGGGGGTRVRVPTFPGGRQFTSVNAADKAINAISHQILGVENAIAHTNNKTQKAHLEHELHILELRKQGYELQRTQLSQQKSAASQHATAQNKAAALQKKQHEAAAKAQKKAMDAWFAWLSHIPSQAAPQQIKLANIQNKLAAATAAGNIGGEQKATTAEINLNKQWLRADIQKLRTVNRALGKRGLSRGARAKLLADKLGLLQEIGTIQGNIGSLNTSLTDIAGGGSSTTTGSFDLAPGGGGVNIPTKYDVDQAVGHHAHHHHHGDINIDVHRDADIEKVAQVIDRHIGSQLHSRVRRAGLRGT